MNKNDDIEIMDDEEVFLTKEVKRMDDTELEKKGKSNAEVIKGIYENDYSLESEKVLKKSKMKYIITVLMWLLFVTFTTIVMYIVIREPDAINKIIEKIF